MTRDDIVRMTQLAGWAGVYSKWESATERVAIDIPTTIEEVERFARLVADNATRGWVGLTDEDFYGQNELQVYAMKYAEAKLKEKNYDKT